MDIVDELRENGNDIPLLDKEYPQLHVSFKLIGDLYSRAAAKIESLRAERTAIKSLCTQDREDMGIELFQKEILAALKREK